MHNEEFKYGSGEMYSNLIDLNDFFKNYSGDDYCIIKMPSYFPNYYEFSDLDILCENKEQMVLSARTFLNKYNVRVNIHYPENGKHSHVDVYPFGKTLDFKFDFIDSFSMYRKNKVSSKFAGFVLKNKILSNGVFVPSAPCEMVVRMLEYIEYKDVRPDKIKHIEYIKSKPEHMSSFKETWQEFITEVENDKSHILM